MKFIATLFVFYWGTCQGLQAQVSMKKNNVRVKDVPVLVEGTAIHPSKPLDGFTFTNISGTCAKGISLANIKKAKLKDITVTGFTGPLLSINNVTGKGLEGAVTIDAPKVPEAIVAPAKAYELR